MEVASGTYLLVEWRVGIVSSEGRISHIYLSMSYTVHSAPLVLTPTSLLMHLITNVIITVM